MGSARVLHTFQFQRDLCPLSPRADRTWVMDSRWKSSFGRSRTPMGTVPISVIYGYKYPLRERGETLTNFWTFEAKAGTFVWIFDDIKVLPCNVSPMPDSKTSQVTSDSLTNKSLWPSSLGAHKPPEIVRRYSTVGYLGGQYPYFISDYLPIVHCVRKWRLRLSPYTFLTIRPPRSPLCFVRSDITILLF